MYGIFTYIWLIFMVNVGNYTSHMDGMGIITCVFVDFQRVNYIISLATRHALYAYVHMCFCC